MLVFFFSGLCLWLEQLMLIVIAYGGKRPKRWNEVPTPSSSGKDNAE